MEAHLLRTLSDSGDPREAPAHPVEPTAEDQGLEAWQRLVQHGASVNGDPLAVSSPDSDTSKDGKRGTLCTLTTIEQAAVYAAMVNYY